jgi:hypothetical protein
MPIVNFVLDNAKTAIGSGNLGRPVWLLSFTAHLADACHQHVDLTTDEGGLQNLEGILTFEASSSPPYMGFENGFLMYFRAWDDDISPTPASFQMMLRMEESDLFRLMDAVIAGTKLLRVSVSVDQMEYGWEPDGSGMRWDNASHPHIEIGGYQLTLAH